MIYLTLACEWDPRRSLEWVSTLGLSQWVFLGEDSTWRIRAERCLFADVPRMSITRRLDETIRQLRKPYIEWIGSMSKSNDSAEWWASEIAAKNPYTNLFIRICFLRIGLELIDSFPNVKPLIVCSSPAVLHELFRAAEDAGLPVKRLNPTLPKRLYQKLRVRGLQWARTVFWYFAGNPILSFFAVRSKRKVLWGPLERLGEHIAYRRQWLLSKDIAIEPFSGDQTVLLFTWVDHRNFTEDGIFVDPHLGPLAESLRALGYEVRYVVRVLPGNDFRELAQQLCEVIPSAYFPEYFVDRAAIGRCQRRACSFLPVVPINDDIDGVPIYGLAREHIEDYRITLSQTLSYEEFVAGLSESGVHPSLIIHTCEGHSWEQALALSVRQHMPTTKVIGFENGTFTPMFHSMYPAKEEFGRRPLPDRVLTYGALMRETLLREGWPAERVREGCALRHDYICRELQRTQPIYRIREGERVKILVATGIGPWETIELIDKAARAFAGRVPFQLIVKCHPMVATDWIQSELGTRLDCDNLSFTSAPIGELLSDAHILLYTFTTVCYEALSHGVLPVFVCLDNFLNLNKMDAFPDLYWQAADSEELHEVVGRLVDMSESEYEEWFNKALAAVRSAFSPVEEEKIRNFVS